MKFVLAFSVLQRFNDSIDHAKMISEFADGFFQKLLEELKRLENHAVNIDEIQMKNIVDFQKAYEVRLALSLSL